MRREFIMPNTIRFAVTLGAIAVAATAASAQENVLVYRLGRDTVAIDQYTRTNNRLTGELVSRAGSAVQRVQYDLTLSNGRPIAATMKAMRPDGTAFPNFPSEWRFTFRADSAIREAVFKDSTNRRAFAAPSAFPALPVFAYGYTEVLAALGRGKRDSVPAIGLGGGVGYIGLETLAGDTLRLRGGEYAMRFTFDRGGRLVSMDGSMTENKALGTRAPAKVDIAAIAIAMRPTGMLSPRQTAFASVASGPILVNYGSPAVRARTVWGGVLIPFDSVWRVGANEATHLATSKRLQMGDMTLEPGVYTLWAQHTRTGTFLIVNKQVGQWGTQYNAANDLGRVAMQLNDAPAFVENFTITIRGLGQGRGAIDMAWGDKVASAPFVVRP
jgi:hypothetical protein